MKKGEQIYIKSFDCTSEEDVYKEGIIIDGEKSSWTSDDYNLKDGENGFESVKDALDKVLDICLFEKDAKWQNFGLEFDDKREYGRFDTDVLVDENNNELTKEEIEMWKRGEKRAWNCHICAYLGIMSVRNFTKKEIEEIGY